MTEVPSHALKSGNVQSCGCSHKSNGEQRIENFLLSKKILYEREKAFADCKSNYKLRFDFYLPDYNCCIEYDGKQHFEPVEYFGGLEKFKETQKHDFIKNQYCEQKQTKLIRISYTSYNDIETILLKEILNETS